ncbi:MAG: TIGR03118 family protein [Terracidiphilus sp.]
MRVFLRRMAGTVIALSLAGAAAFGQHYTQTNLVSSETGVAPVTDPDLINPWGLSRGSGTPWWVSDNATGLSTLYTGAGVKEGLVVTIPPAVTGNLGTPTGTIYNGNATSFLLTGGKPALFLFSTLDGLIVGWNSSAGALATVKTTDGSSFTGLTSAYIGANLYLYAANFTKGRVDVYDSAFNHVDFGEERFDDDWLPRGYVPFNVQAIGNDIVVTYALHEKGELVETDGPGRGFVDIFTSEGRLLKRLEHGWWLNAPWGVALAPDDFGRYSHDLLIGQFAGGGTTQASGYIAAYDLASGRYDGLLEDATGAPLAINGIWAIAPGNTGNNYNSAGAPAAELYFTAGPDHGAQGLYGYLTAVSTELVKGNDQ